MSFGSEGRMPVGVDGRMSPPPLLTAHTDTNPSGRLSVANSTNEVFIDDDPSEDWTRTTAEKDSWAHRERRRSSMWQKIDSYPSSKPLESSPPRSRSRRGSILSLFKHGKDQDGRDVLHSDGPEEYIARNGAAAVVEVERPPSADDKAIPSHRRGSILSMWTWGKDKSGRDVIHSGFEDDE